ncbi:hypothetical protein KL909_001157 [Ogataea angusta]|nr:hypothetical protein KL909_001157 [Ogataea angusta]
MNIGAGYEMAIDVDEADMSILDENLKLTDELTAALSAKLHRVSTSSALAIKSINPLMVKINRLKVQQRNFQNIFKLVESIKDYAEEISNLDKSIGTFGGLDSVSQISSFCNIVKKYQGIQSDLKSKNLKDFEGLRKGLDSSLRDADVTLKFEFINKLKTLSKRLKSNGNKFGKEEDDIIVQLKLIRIQSLDSSCTQLRFAYSCQGSDVLLRRRQKPKILCSLFQDAAKSSLRRAAFPFQVLR